MVKQAIQMTIEGRRYVAIPEAEYRRLNRLAEQSPVPEVDESDRQPAQAALQAMIAQDVRAARQEAGWTQAELADAAGVRVETISRIESGRHQPSVRTLKKLGRAMGLDW